MTCCSKELLNQHLSLGNHPLYYMVPHIFAWIIVKLSLTRKDAHPLPRMMIPWMLCLEQSGFPQSTWQVATGKWKWSHLFVRRQNLLLPLGYTNFIMPFGLCKCPKSQYLKVSILSWEILYHLHLYGNLSNPKSNNYSKM